MGKKNSKEFYLIMLLLFKMLFKTTDPLPQVVNVSVEHCDGDRALIFVCMDTAANPGDRRAAVYPLAVLHVVMCL